MQKVREELAKLPVLFLVASVGAGFFSLGFGVLFNGYRFATAASWSSTPGFVESWNVSESFDPHRYACWVSYLYERDGKAYRGWNVYLAEDAFLGKQHQTEMAAIEALKRYPIGAPVEVRINPRMPQDTVLDPKTTPTGMFFLKACFVAGLLLAVTYAILSNAHPIISIPTLVFMLYGGFHFYLLSWEMEPGAELAQIGTPVSEAHLQVIEERRAWEKVVRGMPQAALPDIRKPDKVSPRDDGEVWLFESSQGLERPGKIIFKSTPDGLVAEQVVNPFITETPSFPSSEE